MAKNPNALVELHIESLRHDIELLQELMQECQSAHIHGDILHIIKERKAEVADIYKRSDKEIPWWCTSE